MSENKKYELYRVHPILDYGYNAIALRDFGDVKKGDMSGYLAREDSLSHDGDCWVYPNGNVWDDAKVIDNAKVGGIDFTGYTYVKGSAIISGNAQVTDSAVVVDNAKVSGNALVCGQAIVANNARIYGNTKVHGDAKVNGNARVWHNAELRDRAIVGGDARVYTGIHENKKTIKTISNIGNDNATLTIMKCGNEYFLNRGCFNGTLKDFMEKANKVYRYEKLPQIIELLFTL